ncbi:hypothetical protein Tco_0791673 [Tanacetum coccineum]
MERAYDPQSYQTNEVGKPSHPNIVAWKKMRKSSIDKAIEEEFTMVENEKKKQKLRKDMMEFRPKRK